MNSELFQKLKEYLEAYKILTELVAQGGISPDVSAKLKDELRKEIDTLTEPVLAEETETEVVEEEVEEEETSQETI
jgi:polyhydroxyalkanoate synthesis regulator phasin